MSDVVVHYGEWRRQSMEVHGGDITKGVVRDLIDNFINHGAKSVWVWLDKGHNRSIKSNRDEGTLLCISGDSSMAKRMFKGKTVDYRWDNSVGVEVLSVGKRKGKEAETHANSVHNTGVLLAAHCFGGVVRFETLAMDMQTGRLVMFVYAPSKDGESNKIWQVNLTFDVGRDDKDRQCISNLKEYDPDNGDEPVLLTKVYEYLRVTFIGLGTYTETTSFLNKVTEWVNWNMVPHATKRGRGRAVMQLAASPETVVNGVERLRYSNDGSDIVFDCGHDNVSSLRTCAFEHFSQPRTVRAVPCGDGSVPSAPIDVDIKIRMYDDKKYDEYDLIVKDSRELQHATDLTDKIQKVVDTFDTESTPRLPRVVVHDVIGLTAKSEEHLAYAYHKRAVSEGLCHVTEAMARAADKANAEGDTIPVPFAMCFVKSSEEGKKYTYYMDTQRNRVMKAWEGTDYGERAGKLRIQGGKATEIWSSLWEVLWALGGSKRDPVKAYDTLVKDRVGGVSLQEFVAALVYSVGSRAKACRAALDFSLLRNVAFLSDWSNFTPTLQKNAVQQMGESSNRRMEYESKRIAAVWVNIKNVDPSFEHNLKLPSSELMASKLYMDMLADLARVVGGGAMRQTLPSQGTSGTISDIGSGVLRSENGEAGPPAPMLTHNEAAPENPANQPGPADPDPRPPVNRDPTGHHKRAGASGMKARVNNARDMEDNMRAYLKSGADGTRQGSRKYSADGECARMCAELAKGDVFQNLRQGKTFSTYVGQSKERTFLAAACLEGTRLVEKYKQEPNSVSAEDFFAYVNSVIPVMHGVNHTPAKNMSHMPCLDSLGSSAKAGVMRGRRWASGSVLERPAADPESSADAPGRSERVDVPAKRQCTRPSDPFAPAAAAPSFVGEYGNVKREEAAKASRKISAMYSTRQSNIQDLDEGPEDADHYFVHAQSGDEDDV